MINSQKIVLNSTFTFVTIKGPILYLYNRYFTRKCTVPLKQDFRYIKLGKALL